MGNEKFSEWEDQGQEAPEYGKSAVVASLTSSSLQFCSTFIVRFNRRLITIHNLIQATVVSENI